VDALGADPLLGKDPAIGNHMINARSETLMEKPSFRTALVKRRCLLIADGFYEWLKQPGKTPSIPYFFHLINRRPFFFAGLWDFWKPAEGDPITSCTIITCPPNELVQPVHERMPVMLSREAGIRWLNTSTPAELLNMLNPFPAGEMEGYAVSPLVNSPAVESVELIKKMES
jgi:putative SOS response-associated peptidase YedK